MAEGGFDDYEMKEREQEQERVLEYEQHEDGQEQETNVDDNSVIIRPNKSHTRE